MTSDTVPTRYPACFYRVSAKAIILHRGRLLLVRESSKRWDLPGGGVEHYEDLHKALERELKEELGLTLISFDGASVETWFSYDHDPLWDRPNLIIAALVKIKNKSVVLTVSKEIDCRLFTRNEFLQLPLEKNIEPFRKNLLNKAFGRA
jgi:8-oxo-dGTP pyrophosphatase MutT (NUDIX family)